MGSRNSMTSWSRMNLNPRKTRNRTTTTRWTSLNRRSRKKTSRKKTSRKKTSRKKWNPRNSKSQNQRIPRNLVLIQRKAPNRMTAQSPIRLTSWSAEDLTRTTRPDANLRSPKCRSLKDRPTKTTNCWKIPSFRWTNRSYPTTWRDPNLTRSISLDEPIIQKRSCLVEFEARRFIARKRYVREGEKFLSESDKKRVEVVLFRYRTTVARPRR
jgi:hypothetical protein